MAVRLIALDVDGTVLTRRGEVSPAVREAVGRCRERGLPVVLCTGRRYRTARPILEALQLEGPVVVQNGVLVVEAASGRTLRHRYLDPDIYAPVLALWRRVGPPLVYVNGAGEGLDFYSESRGRAHPYQAEYLADHGAAARMLPSLDDAPRQAIVMVSCMADGASLRALRLEAQAQLGERLRTNFLMNTNYRGHILEAVSAASGKWPALRAIARELGIEPEQIMAVGDDNNDVEMLAKAGLGVAMGNAIAAAREAADCVTDSNDEDGVAAAIERFALASD